VFVFFESITRLDEFYTFAFAQRPLGGQLAKITEETSELEKEDNIAAAVSSGRVPSLTRAFGRGRHSCAPNIFLFEQIRGGASQRQTLELLVKGMWTSSFSLGLLDQDLERIKITPEIINQMNNTKKYSEILNRHRADHFSTQHLQEIRHSRGRN
jgi:hypothetical protein